MTKNHPRRSEPDMHPSRTSLSAPTARKDWGSLRPHDRVTVHEAKKLPYEAVVDVLTQDATVVWVLPIRIGIRRAFHYSDDVDIVEMS